MRNLPSFIIQTKTEGFKIPKEGKLENSYKPLRNLQNEFGEIEYFTTDKLHYSINNPVFIECQPSYDGSVNLILNDDKNPPLLVNSRFSVEENNTFSIPNHFGTTETNIYSKETVELDTRLYKTITKVPDIKYVGLGLNGKMKVGSYHFYFKYSDFDNNETDFIAESGMVVCHIGGIKDPKSIRMGMQDEDSKKTIKFRISNIDTQYDYLKVYYTRTTSDNSSQELTTAHYIDFKFPIKEESLLLNITGFENILDISIDEINPFYELAGTVKSQAQCQNMLFFGNINKPNIPYEELADLSLRITPSIINNENIGNLDHNYIDRSGKNSFEYYNTYNIYNYLGYWGEEYYRFGIVYLMNDFTLSPVFNTRGIDLTDYKDPNFKIKPFELYKENERVFIEYDSDGYIINSNNFDNNRGVIKLPKVDVIKNDGVFPIGINFKFQELQSGDKNDLITELKKYTRGFFFVRQKRIPTIIAQGCTIGKTKNEFGNLPVIPVSENKAIIEGFLKDKVLEKNTIELNRNKYDVKAILSPEVELREPLFNQILTSNNFVLTDASEQSVNKIQLIDYSSPKHLYLKRDKTSNNSLIKPAILTIINDNLKLTTNGTDYFSARAGEAEEAWKVVDVNNDWKKVPASTINNESNFIRGSFGTYVGVGNANLQYGTIVNIRPEGFNESLEYKTNEFKIRFEDSSHYHSISNRIGFESFSNNVTCYRGDCYIGNFSHRMNRNFIDPELPTNNKIIDVFTWKNNFRVFQDYPMNDGYASSGIYINRVLLEFKESNKGKIIEPTNAAYANSGGLLSTFTNSDPYTIKGCAKINRIDVNSVELGHWFTFKTMSNINVSMRDIDLMNPTEQSIFGHPRSFFPLQKMDNSNEFKLPDSKIINGANSITLSNRYNFLIPNIPFIKNKFDTRILYSNIHITDAFSNGYRVFTGNHFKDLPKTYGALTRIHEMSGNLIAVMESGVLLVPVNERAVAAEGSGGNVYINTANVLPDNPLVLSSDFGTYWKEGTLKTINTVYGIDTVAKKIWKTDGRSFQIISDLKVQKFLNDNINLKESDDIITVGLRNVKVHYNAFKGDVMFTFYNKDKVWNLCYNEKLDKLITRYSWTPSYSDNINNIFFSFDLNSIKSLSNYIEFAKKFNNNILNNIAIPFSSYMLPRNLNNKIADVKNVTLHTDLFKIVNSKLYYSNKESYDSIFNNANSYIDIDVTVMNTRFTLRFFKYVNLNNNIWKHGQAGIYDLQGLITPTKWYDKQELFEFEFVTKDPPIVQKIFDNLKLISNKTQPTEFEFEVVGEGYDWYEYKDEILLINEMTGTTNNTLEEAYKEYLKINRHIKKLPFIKRIRSSDITKKWEQNSTNINLIHDELLSEYRINSNQLGNDIKKVGRLKGNMQYLEDLWSIEIRPINFKYAYLDDNDNLKFTKLYQSRIRDKYLKVKVRYSGKELAIIQAIKTLFTISYA